MVFFRIGFHRLRYAISFQQLGCTCVSESVKNGGLQEYVLCFFMFECTCARIPRIVARLTLRVLSIVYPPYRYAPCHCPTKFPFSMRVRGRARRVNRLRVALIVCMLFRGYGGSRSTAACLEDRSTRGASRREYRGTSRGKHGGASRGKYRGASRGKCRGAS
jgi:hypothetical protein